MKNTYNLDYHTNQWNILTNQWPYVGAVYYDHNGWKWEIVAKNDSFIMVFMVYILILITLGLFNDSSYILLM